MNKQKLMGFIALILVIGGVIILLPKISGTGNLFDGTTRLFEQRNKVDCSVSIINPLLSDVKIVSATCNKIGRCIPLGESGTPLSLFGYVDEGVIQFNTKDFTITEPFSISEFTGLSANAFKTIKKTLCTLDTGITINVIVDDKQVDLKVINI